MANDDNGPPEREKRVECGVVRAMAECVRGGRHQISAMRLRISGGRSRMRREAMKVGKATQLVFEDERRFLDNHSDGNKSCS